MLKRYNITLWRQCKSYHRLQHTAVQTAEPFIGLSVVRRLAAVRSSLNLSPQEVPSYDDLTRWRHVVEAQSILQAADKLQDEDVPTWVFLYLLSTKVQSPSQTLRAVNLMLRRLPNAEPAMQPALLILTARFLAKYQVIAPMTDVVQAFLMLDLKKPSSNFNLLLQATSHFCPHPRIAKLVVRLVDAMHARQLRLHSRTYRSLLSNEIVNLELTKLVQQRMAYEGVTPNAAHLEAFLRVFGRHGAVRTAAEYLKRIGEERRARGQVTPHGVDLTSEGAVSTISQDSANTRWNTQFLRSFGGHAGSAFHYLRGLVEETSTVSLPPPPTPSRSRLISFTRRSRLPFHKPHLGLTSTLSARKADWKTSFDIYDWTTALNSLGRDPRIKSTKLLALFKQSKNMASTRQSPSHSHSSSTPGTTLRHTNSRVSPNLVPAVATYTTVMRGLTKKGDYKDALEVWKELFGDKRLNKRIDARALTVAMDVLTGNGLAVQAFDILLSSVPPIESSLSENLTKRHSRVRKIVVVDTPLVNALMSALTKHSFPDVAILVFEVFEPVFGVHPDAESLGILLKAARKAAADEKRSLTRVIALANPFHRQRASSVILNGMSRQEIIEAIRSRLSSDQKCSDKTRASALWTNESPGLKALVTFRTILLSNFPHLRDVQAPARSVWSDEARVVHPVRDFVMGVVGGRGGLRSQPAKSEEKPLLIGPSLFVRHSTQEADGGDERVQEIDGTARQDIPIHPQITPSATSFHAYIHLLGALHRASEIPLTLSWMRALSLTPSKRLLALSLVLWEDVSLRGPLLEQYESTSEYRRLLRWLEGWVGRGGLPTESMVVWERERLRRERQC